MTADRVMFFTDYPFQFAPNGGARHFLLDVGLSEESKTKIVHPNWDRLSSLNNAKKGSAVAKFRNFGNSGVYTDR